MWKLIDEKLGTPAPAYGELVETFRGEAVVLADATPPHKVGSTGRVSVEFLTGGTAEFFPAVVGLKWVEV